MGTNADTIKVGTAIGLNQHVIFQGDWQQVGSLARVPSKFDVREEFEIVVNVDLVKRTIAATINDTKLTAKLPEDIKEIRYLGYYVKGTSSEFAPLDY